MHALAAEAHIPDTSVYRFMSNQRDILLGAASNLIEILPFLGNTYLSNTAEVAKALEDLSEKTRNLYVIGSQDTIPMLSRIEDAVARGVGYQRLIHSSNTTPELTSHLKNMSVYENSEIRQTDRTLQDITIGDTSLLLPIVNGNETEAFYFRNDPNSRSGFLGYFKNVFRNANTYSFGDDSIKPSFGRPEA